MQLLFMGQFDGQSLHNNNPPLHMEEELKENIPREILEVPQEELLCVNFNLFKW
jgi:hypothetical protein